MGGDARLFEHIPGETGGRREPGGHDGQHAHDIGARLCQRGAGLEAGDALEAEISQAYFAALETQGHQEGDFLIHELERTRQHADDLARIAFDGDAAAQDGRVASETRPPIAV